MPTINKPFLLKLLLVLAVGTAGLFAVHAVQAARIPAALRRMADRAADADKPDAAVHYLRQYLEFRPDDTDARERLAELLRERGGGGRSALRGLYDEILRADPGRHAVRREAAALALGMGRYSDAEGHLDVLLKEFPTDALLWQQRAAAQAGLRRFDAARASYETAVGHAPADALAYQRLAQFVWKDMDRPQDVRPILDRMAAALPASPEPLVTRAKFLALTADPAAPVPPPAKDPVLADLDRAIALAPTHAEALLLKAERLQRHRDVTGAQAALAEGLKHHPGDVRLVRALAWLEVNRGNTAGAIGVLEDAVPLAKDPLDLLVPLADLLLQSGDATKTEGIVRRLEAGRGAVPKLQSKYLRGRLAMRAGKWDDAIALLTDLRTAAVKPTGADAGTTAGLPGLEAQANYLLSACYARKGDTEKEVECLKLMAAKDPNNAGVRAALGMAYLSAGQPADAVREYEAAADAPNGLSAVPTLVRLKALRLAAADAVPEAWAQLDRVIAGYAPRFGPNAPDAVLLAAEAATVAGDPAKAVRLLRKEAARRPGDPRIAARLALAVADAEGVAAGLAALDDAQAAAGDAAELRLARADLYARDPARLRPVPQLEAGTDGWADAEQVRLLYGLVEVYDRLHRPADVLRLYRRIANRRPTEAGVWLAVGERAVRLGDAKAAAEAKAAVARIEGPDGPGMTLFAAWEAVRAGGDTTAARDRLVAKFGPSPDRADACLALARLSPGEAGRLFARAAKLEPAKFEPATGYLAHLAANGPADELARYTNRLATDPRWGGEPFRRAVAAAAVGSPPAAAKAVLAAAAKYVEKRPGGLGWLADAHAAAGLKDEAVALAEKATAAPAATADDWIRVALVSGKAINAFKGRLKETTLAVVLAAVVEHKTGPASAEAAKEAKRSAEMGGVWAVSASEGEKPSPAFRRAFAQERLAIQLARTDRPAAVALLEKYLEAKDLPATDAGWATRNLAMLLAVRGEPADRTRAAELIAKSTDTAGLSADDKRAAASVLASLYRYLDGADRTKALNRAIEVLEEVAKDGKSPRDGFALIRLYRAAGRTDAAVERLNALLARDPSNLDFLLAGLGILVEAGRFEKAKPFADRLLAVAPAEYRVVSGVARYECAAGRPDRGLALAEGYARTADPLAGDVYAKNARTAELLDELARLPGVAGTDAGRKIADAAVARYETLLPGRAESVIAVAGLLAAVPAPGTDRTAAALARVEKHARVIPARTRAAAGVTVLRAAGGSDRQFAQVRTWIDAAKAEDPDAAAVWLADAEFLSLRQDFAGAERAYEEVLKRDPRNVAALNNLAWILAPDPKSAARALELIDRAAKETGLTGELLDTRARVRIAARQLEMAETDAAEALRHDRTPLRYFHLAMALNEQRPPRKGDAEKAFRQAKERGLDGKQVHPADLPAYRVFDNGSR
jgi:predicted Zn-dependent protease